MATLVRSIEFDSVAERDKIYDEIMDKLDKLGPNFFGENYYDIINDKENGKELKDFTSILNPAIRIVNAHKYNVSEIAISVELLNDMKSDDIEDFELVIRGIEYCCIKVFITIDIKPKYKENEKSKENKHLITSRIEFDDQTAKENFKNQVMSFIRVNEAIYGENINHGSYNAFMPYLNPKCIAIKTVEVFDDPSDPLTLCLKSKLLGLYSYMYKDHKIELKPRYASAGTINTTVLMAIDFTSDLDNELPYDDD